LNVKMHSENITLDRAEINIKYRIVEIFGGDLLRMRLQDIGLTSGTVIVPKYRGGGGEIVSYSVRGAHIAFRRETAKQIVVCAADDLMHLRSEGKGEVSEK